MNHPYNKPPEGLYDGVWFVNIDNQYIVIYCYADFVVTDFADGEIGP